MQAQLTQSAGTAAWAARERRSSRVAAVVAAIWLALVACTPLIVRYGPAADDHAAQAFVERIDQPRCGRATTTDLRCPRWDTADAARARDSGDL